MSMKRVITDRGRPLMCSQRYRMSDAQPTLVWKSTSTAWSSSSCSGVILSICSARAFVVSGFSIPRTAQVRPLAFNSTCHCTP